MMYRSGLSFGFALFSILFSVPSPGAIRDGGIDPANLGKGDWIYILSSATSQMGGAAPQVTNLASLMIYEKNLGCNYLIIKCAEGGGYFPSAGSPQFTAQVVDAGHAAGLKIFGYTRTYGTNLPGEFALATYAFNVGADGYVLDAEGEWETLPNKSSVATNLVLGIRTNWPTKFLAHSPFAYPDAHTGFPYKEFGYYCDAVIPQDYWVEFGDTPAASVNRMNTGFRNLYNGFTGIWTNSIKPIVPAGQGWSSASGTVDASQITQFYNSLKSIASPAFPGGYKGANFWRAELHPADVLVAIRTNTIGTVPAGAPAVTNISVTPQAGSAIVVWTTEQSSDSAVDFGLSVAYGNSVTNSPPLYYHTVTITGLAADTTYHFRVKSKNASNQTGVSADYVFTTLAANVPDVVVESRGATGALTPNPPYADVNFADSTLKSSIPTLTGMGSRYAFSGTPNFTVKPTLPVAGGTYDVYVTHGAAGSVSPDITVAVSAVGATGLPATTTTFRQTNANNWYLVGRMTLNNAVTVPAITFTYSSGTLNSTSGRMYSDSTRYVYVPPPPSAPSIASQPQSQTINQGSTAQFSVVASGTAPLAYQWSHAGTNLASATGSSLTLNNVQPDDAGSYMVLVTNSIGSTNSSTAQLTVNLLPEITTQPVSVTTNAGVDVQFFVVAVGTPPLFYQWRWNGSEIPGATSSSYVRTNVQPLDAGEYSVTVSNVAAAVTSDGATLSLLSSPAPHLDALTLLPDGTFNLALSGTPGNYAVQVSSNLLDWVALTNLTLSGTNFDFIDAETNLPARFYRAYSVP